MSDIDSNRVSILRNKGTGGIISFDDKINISSLDRAWFIAAADIDGDGKPDILTRNSESVSLSIAVLRNKTGEPEVVPSGVNPVSGGVETNVIVDPSVQNYRGAPYVQRHYDIEPETNVGTATATITLHFTQSDFNNYNAYPNHGLDLPTGPADNAGKAALRVFQYHGVSTTSQPGSYSGSSIEINPDDTNIKWDAANLWWDVTFDVNGFSGFFVNSLANSLLPLNLLSFSGNLSGSNCTLQWVTTNEINVSYFELQRSVDGLDFVTINKIKTSGIGTTNQQYQYTDAPGAEPVYYYRLKIVDNDGSFTYSKVVSMLSAGRTNLLTIYPNPAKDNLTVNHPESNLTAQIAIMDMTGRIVRIANLNKNTLQTKLSVKGISPGTYKLIWKDGMKTFTQTLIIEGSRK